jgi:hypothetical protein
MEIELTVVVVQYTIPYLVIYFSSICDTSAPQCFNYQSVQRVPTMAHETGDPVRFAPRGHDQILPLDFVSRPD